QVELIPPGEGWQRTLLLNGARVDYVTEANSISREVYQLTQACGSRDAFPSLVVPLVHLSLPLVSLSFQPRTYNLSTLPFRDSVQIAENDLVVKKFPENGLDVKKFPENDFEVLERISKKKT
ncbi:hypothetical protein Tco_1224559, partial [Tanacetum coccineum]